MRTLLLLIPLALIGCNKTDTHILGNCLIPKGKTTPDSIIRLVSISSERVLFFSHFLSNGSLILSEDYQQTTLDILKENYVLVECPLVDGNFSPHKYLDENSNRAK